MKINEIGNKLFGLSDLKGLITEIGDKIFNWGDYYKENPARLDQDFLTAMGLRQWLEANGLKKIPKEGLTPEQVEDILGHIGVNDSEIRKHFGDDVYKTALMTPGNYFRPKNGNYASFRDNFQKGRRSFGGVQQKGGKSIEVANNVQPSGVEGVVDKPTTIKMKKLDAIKGIFDELGGENIVVPDFFDHENLVNYVLTVNNLSVRAGELAKSRYPGGIVDFAIGKNLPGNETNPFYFFLLFYYFNCCQKSGSKDKIYINNIGTLELKEYTKYVLHVKPNIYDTVEANINNVKNGWENILNAAGFGGNEFSTSRSWAYFESYQKIYGNILSKEFLSKMARCFVIPETILFDPVLNNITDSSIGDGIRRWIGGKGNNTLQELIKPQLVVDIDDGCSAEKIFYVARALSGLMEASYKKYGKIAETSEMTVDFLLMDGMGAINKWNKNKNKEVIPAALVPLKTIYDAKKKVDADGEALTEEIVPFWRILNFKNEFKDKTQGEIYYFLINNSNPSVEWQYEYNRKKKTDSDLQGQSIDILGRTESNTYCFEYQGEQHYRPITVTYDDYSAFPLFTEMREYILTKCGFIQKTVGGTKFYSGPETANADRMREIRQIIINAYKEFANRISDTGLDSGNSLAKIKNRLSEASFVPTVNKWKTVDGKRERVKFDDEGQLLAYFQSIIRHGADDEEIFNAPEVGGVIPYLGSPRRFLDEVKTAQDMGRDITKRNVIRNSSKKNGWVLSYIIPQHATEDEKEYTIELAGGEEFVFSWNKEGKDKLIGFLHDNNIGVGDQNSPTALNENKTLFEQIISEIFTGYDSL